MTSESLFSRLWSSVSSVIWSVLQSLGLQNKRGRLILLGLDNAGKTTLLHRLQTDTIRSFPPTDRPNGSCTGNGVSTTGSNSSYSSNGRRTSTRTTNQHQHQNTVQLGGIQFQMTDLGGHEAVRHLWGDYTLSNNNSNYGDDDGNHHDNEHHHSGGKMAIIFVIDAADRDRLEEAAYELDALMQTVDTDVPLCLLLNKCDLRDQAVGTAEALELIEWDRLVQERAVKRDRDDLEEEENVANTNVNMNGGNNNNNDNNNSNGNYQNKKIKNMAVFRISVFEGTGYTEAFRWVGKQL